MAQWNSYRLMHSKSFPIWLTLKGRDFWDVFIYHHGVSTIGYKSVLSAYMHSPHHSEMATVISSVSETRNWSTNQLRKLSEFTELSNRQMLGLNLGIWIPQSRQALFTLRVNRPVFNQEITFLGLFFSWSLLKAWLYLEFTDNPEGSCVKVMRAVELSMYKSVGVLANLSRFQSCNKNIISSSHQVCISERKKKFQEG